MRIHYYLDWFYENGFSKKLADMLQEDIKDRTSLVMVSAVAPQNINEKYNAEDVFEKTWFDQANIRFKEYHLIDHSTQKENAQRLIENASIIFLCGGSPQYQMELLKKYELTDLIKENKGLIIGTSAGGMTMASNYVDQDEIYQGLGLDNLAFEAHFDCQDMALLEKRFPLSEKINIYVAADKNGAVRVKGNQVDIIGSVYLISNRKVQKLVA